MGVYLSFNFIKKVDEIIVGNLPTLKIYEAKLSLAEKNYHNNANDGVSFKNGGYIFSYFEENSHQFEYYSYHYDSYFIKLAMLFSEMDQRYYEERSIYLFEISALKKGLKNILSYAKGWSVKDQEIYEQDYKLVQLLYDNIIKNENENVLVSCDYG